MQVFRRGLNDRRQLDIVDTAIFIDLEFCYVKRIDLPCEHA